MGVVDASAGLEQSAFRRRLSLVARDERCRVKIAALGHGLASSDDPHADERASHTKVQQNVAV